MDKISCVIVDDDALSREALAGQCRSLPYVDVVGSMLYWGIVLTGSGSMASCMMMIFGGKIIAMTEKPRG
jgi:hypothetical protein